MPKTPDTIDLHLLKTNKEEFILRSQYIMEIGVKYCISRGIFSPSQYRDRLQSVNEELIRRLPSIERNYNGSSLMSTYLSVIVRNICFRLADKESRRSKTIISPDHSGDDMDGGERTDSHLFVMDELRRFSVACAILDNQSGKLFVLLKVAFSLPVTIGEIQRCFAGFPASDHRNLFEHFGGRYDSGTDFAHFAILSPFFRQMEKNSTSIDSLRRRANAQIQRLITLMNGKPPQRAHTKETIKILLERYHPSEDHH